MFLVTLQPPELERVSIIRPNKTWNLNLQCLIPGESDTVYIKDCGGSKVLGEAEVTALCGSVNFFRTKLGKSLSYLLGFVHGCFVTLKQEKAFPKLLP